MNVLVLYGTTEGQTRKIASFIADRLTAAGHAATLVDANDVVPALDPASFDAVLIAGSLHLGRYQNSVVHFVKAHRAALNARATAFISVSLAAAGDEADDVAGLEKCVHDFLAESGWQPRAVHHAAGAFRYTQYDFFKRWAMKYIAYRKGQPTDTSKDFEYTDWDALGRFIDQFAAQAGRGG
jgi:menaquinone-dependent protoporphyrinogen oxidase